VLLGAIGTASNSSLAQPKLISHNVPRLRYQQRRRNRVPLASICGRSAEIGIVPIIAVGKSDPKNGRRYVSSSGAGLPLRKRKWPCFSRQA
jgi:hypothetical protein